MIPDPLFPIDQIRNDTPGCLKLIHLNNAGSSLPSQETLDVMITYLRLEARMGGYEAARLKAGNISSVYDSISNLINAYSDEIAITESATRAWNMAFYSIKFAPGDRILISATEYISNYIAYAQIAKRNGIIVDVIPNEKNGQLSVTALENMISSKVKLIAVTHVPSNSGSVQPAAVIGKIANKAGIYYLLDACQSVGQMPIDVKEIGCDFLSVTGRKYLRGPRGTGFLFVRKEVINQLEPPFLDLHSAQWMGNNSYKIRLDARRFENWEFNIAAKLGLGAAVDYALKIGVCKAYSYIQSLSNYLRNLLSNVRNVCVYDQGADLCGIVTFTIQNAALLKIRDKLMLEGVNVSITEATGQYWANANGARPAMIRASVHYYNTPDEISRFVEIISRIEPANL
ncbi:MAG: aminotransferase class V-fold PLP-dependent enzyme [Ferruginibacter sp.]